MRRRTQNTAGMQMHVAFGCEANLNSSICVYLRMLNICIAQWWKVNADVYRCFSNRCVFLYNSTVSS